SSARSRRRPLRSARVEELGASTVTRWPRAASAVATPRTCSATGWAPASANGDARHSFSGSTAGASGLGGGLLAGLLRRLLAVLRDERLDLVAALVVVV